MQFMIFKHRAQRLEPCHILEGLPDIEGKSALSATKHFLIFSPLSWLNTNESVERLGLRHKEIFVRTHLFHRGSSSQRTPRPGWPPASTTEPPERQVTNVRIDVHNSWGACCCWGCSSVRTETHERLQEGSLNPEGLNCTDLHKHNFCDNKNNKRFKQNRGQQEHF